MRELAAASDDVRAATNGSSAPDPEPRLPIEIAPMISPVPVLHDDEQPDEVPAELRSQVQRGLGWSLVNSMVSRLFSVTIGLIMARLLVPQDYGVFAVGLVVLGVLQSANELGTSVAIVRWQGDARRPADTALTIAVGFSLILYALAFTLAPYVSEALGAPEATALLRWLAVCVVIDGFTTIPVAMLGRAFLQKRRALIDFVGLIVSSAVSIALAASGHGPMSLVWGSVISSLAVAVLVYALTPYRPKPAFRRDDARELLRVGLPLGGTSLVFLCILNVDYVIVGRQLGADALGFYLLAFNLSMWPSNLLSLAVRRVAIPGFAQLYDDPAALSRSFGRAFGALAGVGLLAAVVLGLLSTSIISVLYGERWAPSADALSFLAVFGLCRVLIDLSYDLMVAMGRSARLLALQLIWFFLLIPAIVIGVHLDGIAGAGVAHVVVAGGAVLPAFLIALRHAGISLRPLLSALRRPLGATAVATAVVLVARAMTLPQLARLLLVGGLAFVAFAAIAVPFRELGRWWSQRRASAVSPT